jgi:FkbM family methyltransferase
LIDWSKYASQEMSFDDVRALSAPKEKVWGWTENGMYIGGTDDMIAMRFFSGKGYEEVTRELWRRCCKDADLVVDVGTHSGIFSLDAYRAGAKRVISCEPNPYNYSRMSMNLRYNGFSATGAYPGAVGEEDRVGMLLIKAMPYMVYAAGRMDLENENGMQIPVLLRRLDTLIRKSDWGKVRVVKIDAENYTAHVIRGMSKIFAEGFRPDLIIECTEAGMGKSLKELGYRFWRIWETGTIEEVEDLTPHNPDNNYNGTDENCRNRFASVTSLPEGT